MSAATPPLEHGHTSAGRILRFNMSDHQLPPVNPVVASTAGPVISALPTRPDIVTSPLRADGQTPTTGLMFMLTALVGAGSESSAEPTDPDGFIVTVWVRNPVNAQWGDTQAIQVPFGEWVRTFDFNGGDLYFQFAGFDDASNFLDLHLVEL
jgi:hypothetical protein